MINFKAITTALQNQLIAANTENRSYTITRNAAANDDPNIAVQGWIGVYRGSVKYDPYTTGSSPWLATIEIKVEIQAASAAGHEDCETRLDALESFIMEAIESDRTIGGYVGIVTQYSLDYADTYDLEDLDIYYQTSVLTITAEVRA